MEGLPLNLVQGYIHEKCVKIMLVDYMKAQACKDLANRFVYEYSQQLINY